MIIAVDFDGTIVEHQYPRIGKPIPFAIETLKKLKMEGHFLILWTVREGDLLDEAVEYCRKNGVEFYAINSSHPAEVNDHNEARKVSADLFIDDRNLGGLPDWGVIFQMIHSEETFNYVPVSEYRVKKKKNLFIRFGELIEKLNIS